MSAPIIGNADTPLSPVSPTGTPRWPSFVALAVLAAGLGFVAGPAGLVAWVLTAAVWYTLGTPYALAAGHVLLVVLFPTGIDPVSFAVVESGFVAIVFASATQVSRPIRFIAVASVATTVLVGSAWLVSQVHSLWAGAAVLVGLGVVAAYALHRYELTRLGLVDTDRLETTDQ